MTMIAILFVSGLSLVEAGVEVLTVNYFDNDARVADIRAGRV